MWSPILEMFNPYIETKITVLLKFGLYARALDYARECEAGGYKISRWEKILTLLVNHEAYA